MGDWLSVREWMDRLHDRVVTWYCRRHGHDENDFGLYRQCRRCGAVTYIRHTPGARTTVVF